MLYSLRQRNRRTPGSRNREAHDHPGFEVSWIRGGAIDFDLDTGRRIGALDGGCLVVSPDVVTTPDVRAAEVTQLILGMDLLREAAEALRGARVPAGAFSHAAGSRIADLCAVIAREAREVPAQDPAIDALVHALATTLVRGGEPRDEVGVAPAIRRAIAFLEAHHAEPLRVDDLARAAAMPRFGFLRTFKAQVGASPYQYLLAHRLDRAAATLREDDVRTVLEIAIAHGFDDPGRFARMFARRFGCTPRAWRARFA